MACLRLRVPLLLHGGPDEDDPTGRVILTADRSVSIVNVSRDDARTYSCRAYNTIGADTRTYSLVVQGRLTLYTQTMASA